ncbi:MAG: DUF6090 family protein [Gelidibacter sp.]
MIKLFKNIRKNLLSENKTTNYLKYAIGEIILVVIGILIALTVNNWNERKKTDSQFKTSIENLYNSIMFDVENFQILQKGVRDKIELIPKVLSTPTDSINGRTIQNAFFVLNGGKPYYSETPFFLNNLKADPNNVKQTEIVKEITNYSNSLKANLDDVKENAVQMMINQGIPFSIPIVGFTNKFETIDSLFYNNYHFGRFNYLLNQPNFKAEMQSLEVSLTFQYYGLNTEIGSGKSILALIKNYYPKVKILYKDVGIIGTSINGFDDVGAKSTPMIETDFNNSIWELKLHLKKGAVKFRCRDSWSINWGGDTFPEGKGYQDGPDIKVSEEGTYQVTLNLTNKTYKFVKLDDKTL